MVNLMNMTERECTELIEVLEKEQRQLQAGVDRIPNQLNVPSNESRQEMIRRLLWKVRAGSSSPDILDSSELIEYRIGGYC